MENSVSLLSGKPLFSPDIKLMIDQTIELMKLDVVQGMTYEQEPKLFRSQGIRKNPSRLGKIVSSHLKSLKAGTKYNRRDFSKTLPINQLYDADIRKMARRHNVDLMAKKPVMKQVETGKAFAYIKAEIADKGRVKNSRENLFDTEIDLEEASRDSSAALRLALPHLGLDPGIARIIADRYKLYPIKIYEAPDMVAVDDSDDDIVPEIQLNRGLKFRLHRVKCVDETNPEWPGDDEIAMGGTAVDPKKVATKINEFRVGNSFDDGESKTYSPPRILTGYNLDSLSYPADFLVVLALAEKDNGGMSDFLTDMWEAIKDEVALIMVAVGAAAGAAAGAAIGGALGTAIGGPLGTIIGLVAGAILGALVGWLISALKDDFFEPKSAALRLPTHDSTFSNGSLSSSIMTLNFRDHGGHYRAYYSWQIIR